MTKKGITALTIVGLPAALASVKNLKAGLAEAQAKMKA